MPLIPVETAPGFRVVLRRCDGCGAPNARYGNGSLRAALQSGELGRVRCWCGLDGCRLRASRRAAP